MFYEAQQNITNRYSCVMNAPVGNTIPSQYHNHEVLRLNMSTTVPIHSVGQFSPAASRITNKRIHLQKKRNNGERVVIPNVAYLMSLPSLLANEDFLRRPECLGQYGRIEKIIVHKNGTAHVTFASSIAARSCIKCLDGFVVNGVRIAVLVGTTKYPEDVDLQSIAANDATEPLPPLVLNPVFPPPKVLSAVNGLNRVVTSGPPKFCHISDWSNSQHAACMVGLSGKEMVYIQNGRCRESEFPQTQNTSLCNDMSYSLFTRFPSTVNQNCPSQSYEGEAVVGAGSLHNGLWNSGGYGRAPRGISYVKPNLPSLLVEDFDSSSAEDSDSSPGLCSTYSEGYGFPSHAASCEENVTPRGVADFCFGEEDHVAEGEPLKASEWRPNLCIGSDSSSLDEFDYEKSRLSTYLRPGAPSYHPRPSSLRHMGNDDSNRLLSSGDSNGQVPAQVSQDDRWSNRHSFFFVHESVPSLDLCAELATSN